MYADELRKSQDFFATELQGLAKLREKARALGDEGSQELEAVEMMIRNSGYTVGKLGELIKNPLWMSKEPRLTKVDR